MKISRRHFVKDISLTVTSGLLINTFSGCHRLDRYMHRSSESAPTLIVDIDFNDEVIIRLQPITESQVEELVEQLSQNGVDVIFLRMGYLGYLPYHTDHSYPVGFDEDHARQNPFTSDSSALEKWITQRKEWNERYRQVLETFNPPEIFIREGHKRGMKVIMWIDIFDDMYSGHRSKFIDEHPYCQWVSRDGQSYFKGLISYAWKESRDFRIKQAKELLALGADGIHCSTSAHCRHLPNRHENDFYGFEKPVVDEYQKRYGVDIRKDDSFDKDKWHIIKGEFMNLLYKELADVCHHKGKELWIGLQLGDYTNLSADPYFGANVVARYKNLWKELVDDTIADAFLVGDYEICSQQNHAYWSAKNLNPVPTDDLFSWSADYYQPHCNSKTKLYLFGEWLSASEPEIEKQLTKWSQRTLTNGFDGIDIHEAANFENPSTKMKLLKRMKRRLQGKKIEPYN